jgi:hypothetical protein
MNKVMKMEKPKVRIKNLVWGILFQVTRKDFMRGNVKAILHINSHIVKKTKQPKVAYGHYETALRAATRMAEKNNKTYGVYKCVYCDSWHIGKKRYMSR